MLTVFDENYLFHKSCGRLWVPGSGFFSGHRTEGRERMVFGAGRAGWTSPPHTTRFLGRAPPSPLQSPQSWLASGLFWLLLMHLLARPPRLQWYLWCPSKYQVVCWTSLSFSSNIFLEGNLRCQKLENIAVCVSVCEFGGRSSTISLYTWSTYHTRLK